MTPFRWGILGTGNIARSMAQALTHVPGALRGAVASRSASTAAAFADQCGFDRAHGAYSALYADPDIDIIYIATPNALHKDNILDALSAGKHVLCEKPMTLSETDSAACFAAAGKAGLVLIEAMWTAFFPAMQKAIAVVQSGQIGTPRFLDAQFVSWRDPASHPILFDPDLGGGARNDLGIYPVAAALLLAGPAQAVTAHSTVGPTGVDEMSAMIVEHESGVVSQLTCGFRAEMPIAVRVVGTKGSLEIPHTFHCPQQVIVRAGDMRTVFDLPSIGVGYAHEAIAMQDCIARGAGAPIPWGKDQSLQAARILAGAL